MAERSVGSKSSSNKGSAKAARKKSRRPAAIDLKAVKSGHIAVYGDVLRQAVARGDLNEMRKVAALARTLIKDAQSALQRLEASVKRLED